MYDTMIIKEISE